MLSLVFFFFLKLNIAMKEEEELNATGVEQEVTANLPVIPAVISG